MDPMVMTLGLILVGLVLLTVGGEVLVRGASGAARSLGVSPLVIGLTLVGFGTSMPELVTSVQAAFAGAPGIAVGNVVGSNIANILLILGVTALIMPIAVQKESFRRDGAVMLGASLLLVAICLYGNLSTWVGAVFVAGLIGYIGYTFWVERKSEHPAHAAEEDGPVKKGWVPIASGVALAAVGIAVTILGARLLVDGSVTIARSLGVSDTLIGLTIVAVGTSLPELVTSVIAALRRHADIAIGNIVGSNIYNILGILGVTALIKPIAIPAVITSQDIWVMLAATVGLIALAAWGWVLGRAKGLVLLGAYVAYILVLIWQAGALGA